MKTPDELNALIELSVILGRDPLLVQGGGGNLSLKDGKVMWVKASGFWLRDAHEKEMYVPVDLGAVRSAMAEADGNDIVIDTLGGADLRPSIETTLHAVMPDPVVAHVHSVAAIAASVRADGLEAIGERLAGVHWAWVPYARPGVPLTRAIAAATDGSEDVLVLENHGVVAGGATCEMVAGIIADVEERLATDPREAPLPDYGRLREVAKETGLEPSEDKMIHGLATDHTSLAHARLGPLYPDHVVFLGMICPEYVNGNFPDIGLETPFLLVPAAGTLVHQDISPGALAMLRCWGDVTARLPAGARVRPLSDEECFVLLGWEAEDYRRKLLAR